MADQVLSADNGDTFPVTGTVIENRGTDTTFQFVNGLDVSATFTIDGTRQGDSGFSESVELTSASVNSGATDSFQVTEEWDLLRVDVDATTPTSGTAEAYQHKPRN